MADFLGTATAIGQRIARQACHWQVRDQVPGADERQPIYRRAGAELYQGRAGIAFFLGELYRLTSDAEVGRAARGGLEHALAEGEKLPVASFGFHNGRVGIAWVAARLAEIFERPDFAAAARRLLAPLAGQESADAGLDVIAGAGGAIPALLELASRLERGELVDMARRLGDRLVESAHRAPDGWSWDTMPGASVRCLTGFAHGASGMGLALLELAHATGDGRYRFAAEMAFLYERQHFDERHSNWPDLRHEAVAEHLLYEREEELRQAVLKGTLPPYRPVYKTAWCHGSPGIGLARLRAFELTGQDLYRREAEAALCSTLESLAEERLGDDNFSLCHGIAGNCELPFYAAEALDRPELLRAVERAAVFGVETYEGAGRSWRCGTLGDVTDPSLLLGEAGIGLFYLRLVDLTVPSVLWLRPGGAGAAADVAGYEETARESVDESFGDTLRLFSRLASPKQELQCFPPLIPPGGQSASSNGTPLLRSPLATAYEGLCAFVDRQDEPRRQLLDDAFLPERSRYELTLEVRDFTAEYLRSLVRPAWEEIDPETASFVFAAGGLLVSTGRDWEAWTAESGSVPPEAEVFHLIYRQDHRMRLQRVGAFAGFVLQAVEKPSTAARICDSLAVALGGVVDRQVLLPKVLRQLEELSRAGYVDVLASRQGLGCPSAIERSGPTS